MIDHQGGYLDEEGDQLDPAMVEMIFDLRALLEESREVVAIEDELVRKGVIRPGPNLWVEVTRVLLAEAAKEGPLPRAVPPILSFVVSDGRHRSHYSFAIEWALVVDALHLAHPSVGLGGPVPAFVDEVVSEGVIRSGAKRFLSLSVVTLIDSLAPSFDAGARVRFEVANEQEDPLYSFTVDWPLAFLVVNLAYPEHGRGTKGGQA